MRVAVNRQYDIMTQKEETKWESEQVNQWGAPARE